MDRFTCINCGLSISERDFGSDGSFCPNCGVRLEYYKLRFTGTAGEYFRIWIVNTFLTILTLGIYAAWAKVRTRQYFYRHTILHNQSFDYTANPLVILKGHLIIGGGMLLYYFTEAYNPTYSVVIVGIFYLVLPFLIYKSLRFFARNSAFRNIRFRFFGTLGESYKTYLLFPILIPFTLGLIIPYWAFRQKKYFFSNIAFGTSTNLFEGRSRPFYKYYGITLLIGIAILIVFSMLMGFFFSGLSSAIKAPVAEGKSFNSLIVVIIFSMYLAMLILYTFVQQYLYANLMNYCWGQSTLWKLRFQSTLKVHQLLWIRISNIIAIIFSLGLLIPWAKVRRTRYILNNLRIITDQSLDGFTAAVEPDESYYGEAATDFFDIEIGL